MFKKLILGCLLLGLLLGIGGCTSVSAMSISYIDGTMEVSTTIVLDKDKLDKQNIDYTDMVAYLNDCANDYWRILDHYFDTEFALFKAGVTAAQDYRLSISFDSAENFRKFARKDESSPSNPTIVKHFLISQNILLDTSSGGGALLDTLVRIMDQKYIDTDNVESQELISQVYLERFCNQFDMTQDRAKNFLSQINFKLIYAFDTDERIRSNADSVMAIWAPAGVDSDKRARYTAHVYNCTIGQKLPDIILYRNCLVRENVIEWYCSAIGVSVIFGLLLWLILYINAKTKQKYNAKRENNGNYQQSPAQTEQKDSIDDVYENDK